MMFHPFGIEEYYQSDLPIVVDLIDPDAGNFATDHILMRPVGTATRPERDAVV